MVETEYKFYSPGKFALDYGRDESTSHERLEVVTITSGEQIFAYCANGDR